MDFDLVDDVWDLDAVVVDDLPFAAYYSVEAEEIPEPPPPAPPAVPVAPTGGGMVRTPSIRRRRPARRFTHVAAGGLAVGGAAAISRTTVCWAVGGVAVGGAAGLAVVRTWRAAGGLAVSGVAEVELLSPFRDRLPGLRRDDDELLLDGLL